jgi:hypothetical protein
MDEQSLAELDNMGLKLCIAIQKAVFSALLLWQGLKKVIFGGLTFGEILTQNPHRFENEAYRFQI